MAAINLAAVMDAIADTITGAGVMDRAYAWPAETVSAPCAVVGYPGDIEFDVAYNRASDQATFPVWLIVGKASDRSARDAVSALITGATGIKEAIDGTLGGAVQTARLTTLRVEEVTVNGVAYLAAVAQIEVYS